MLELKGRQQQETEGGLLFASRRTEVCARSQLEGPYVGDSLCVCCAGLPLCVLSLLLLCLRFCVQTTEKAGSVCAILTQPIS